MHSIGKGVHHEVIPPLADVNWDPDLNWQADMREAHTARGQVQRALEVLCVTQPPATVPPDVSVTALKRQARGNAVVRSIARAVLNPTSTCACSATRSCARPAAIRPSCSAPAAAEVLARKCACGGWLTEQPRPLH